MKPPTETDARFFREVNVEFLVHELKDPIAVIKWKEILDMLEGATDRCKDVATVLEGIFVKHA